MYLKKSVAIILIGFLILSGCNKTDSDQATIDQIVALTAQSVVSTQLSTLLPNTATETPSGNEQATPTFEEPSPSPADATITITNIQETGRGQAVVYWDAVGEFPSGFKVVWTTEQIKPTFPKDTNTYTSDPFARSALISGNPGSVYLVRVCRFTGDACDVYSNLGIFAFPKIQPTATLQPTSKTIIPTFKPGGGGGTIKTATPTATLKITKVSGGNTGKALIEWTSDKNPSNGFKILYSITNATPTLGTDPYYVITDNAARSAYVDGVSETKYYYRVCKFNGSTCEAYSNVFAFTFPKINYTATPSKTPTASATPDASVITITDVTSLSAGAATLNWTATGVFPNGFKVLFSTTNATPTLGAAEMIQLTDGALRTTTVNGVPRSRYYYRICKYNGSTCTIYSNVVEFTYPDIAEDPGIDLTQDLTVTTPGSVKLDWVLPAGDNAGGYLILQSFPSNPIFPEAVKYVVSDPTARTYTVTGLTSTLIYNFRLCLYNLTICTVYSETLVGVTAP
jgi:hypothetical protein